MPKQLIGLVSPRDRKVATLTFASSATDTAKVVCANNHSQSAGSYLSRFPGTGFVSFSTSEELQVAADNSSDQALSLIHI